jgi:hypothetical protein
MMPGRHKNHPNGIITIILISPLIFLLSLTVGSEENEGTTDLHLFPGDVGLLKKGNLLNSQMPELEPIAKYGSFLGLKVTLKLEGGWNASSGGDITRGIKGMYDNAAASVFASGLPILEDVKGSYSGGIEAGGDLIYCLTPLFGIGIGAARVSTGKESHILFRQEDLQYYSLRIWPRTRLSALRASLFYSLPFASRLAISFRGGPALYSAHYNYSMGGNSSFLRNGLVHKSYSQEVKAKQIGFEGGLGFEFNPNPFVAIFVELQGRYAKIGGLEGKEEAVIYQGGQLQKSVGSGAVYLVETAADPELDLLLSEEAVSARHATLDFSGVSVLAGLKFRL